jgi:hypothetical protein
MGNQVQNFQKQKSKFCEKFIDIVGVGGDVFVCRNKAADDCRKLQTVEGNNKGHPKTCIEGP